MADTNTPVTAAPIPVVPPTSAPVQASQFMVLEAKIEAEAASIKNWIVAHWVVIGVAVVALVIGKII